MGGVRRWEVLWDRTTEGFLEEGALVPTYPRHRGDEGLRLLHGLEANLATSLQTPQEA